MRNQIWNEIIKPINNNRGALILEHVLATMYLTLMSAFVITSVWGAYALFFESYEEYEHIVTSYGELEQRNEGVTLPGFETTQTGTITYQHGTGTITISGKYYYDNEENKMGEFVID